MIVSQTWDHEVIAKLNQNVHNCMQNYIRGILRNIIIVQ